MLRRHWLAILAGVWLGPVSAGAVSLVVDSLGAPSVVNAGDSVSFSFALRFDPGETLLATQAEITAPQLSEFSFERARSPWDLAANFRLRGDKPMWVYAENAYGEDAPGVTYEEIGGLAPLGRLSATATYNGEIEFLLHDWVLSLLDGTAIPLDPAWAHIRTGITIVGGADLPPPPPPPAAPAPAPALQPAPVVPPPATASAELPIVYRSAMPSYRLPPGFIPNSVAFYPTTSDTDPRIYKTTDISPEGATPEPSAFLLVLLAGSSAALTRLRARRSTRSA